MSINDLIRRHSIVDAERRNRSRDTLVRFGAWINGDDLPDWHLALYDFVKQRPLLYFSDDEVTQYLEYFIDNASYAFDGIALMADEITHAVETLIISGPSSVREDLPSLSKAKDLADLEQIWHPDYQRYAEHAYNHLINLLLFILEEKNKKKYREQTLSNRVVTLRANGFSDAAEGFDSAVRNAISHGSVRFRNLSISYIDRKGERNISATEFFRLFDSLVNTCNAIVIATIIFILNNLQSWSRNLSQLPLGVRYLMLRGACTHQGFTLNRIIPSKLFDKRMQLNVTCSTPVPSRQIHQFEAVYLAGQIQDLGGDQYDRFSFSIDCGRSLSASLFLNGRKLLSARNRNASQASLGDVFETNMLWHEIGPVRRKWRNFKLAFRISWDSFLHERNQQQREVGLSPVRDLYSIRDVANSSVKTLRRVDAKVILIPRVDIDLDLLRKIIVDAVRRLRRYRVPSQSLGSEGWLKRKPSSVFVRFFDRDDRLRNLSNANRKDRSLVAAAEWKRNGKQGVFVKEPSEVYRRIRISYIV